MENTNKLINSELPGFYKKTPQERIEIVSQFAKLSQEDKDLLTRVGCLDSAIADKMIENSIGNFPLPLGIATNFRINGKDYLIPMACEEPSVIAAASYAAKLARPTGGFMSTNTEPLMIAQIQLVSVKDLNQAETEILKHKESIINLANAICPNMKSHDAGAKDLQVRTIQTQRGPMLIVHLIVNVGAIMGANVLNKMAEGVTPRLEELSCGKARLRILSNLAVHRLFRAEAIWYKQDLEFSAKGTNLSGEEIIEGILDAWAFAEADPFRAATNNKGIMNGIDAVTIATGNDVRSVESAAHGFAAYKSDHYTTLTHYEKTPEGHLKGIIELPLTLGTAGGITQVHPIAKISNKILGIQNSDELGQVVASVGLAQNFAAIRALVTEGILRGHMKLHAKNVALLVGVKSNMVDVVANLMALEGNISTSRAKELMLQICHVM